MPRFKCSWDSCVYEETVEENMRNFVLPRKTSARAVQTLMTDDLNMDPRVRPSEYHSHMLGFGRESDFSGISGFHCAQH